jgi:hypothetical protein
VARVFNPSRKDKHWGAASWRGINNGNRQVSRLPITLEGEARRQAMPYWQLQRINLIAFQAPKRARPFTVNRYHQHHHAAAVLASPNVRFALPKSDITRPPEMKEAAN